MMNKPTYDKEKLALLLANTALKIAGVLVVFTVVGLSTVLYFNVMKPYNQKLLSQQVAKQSPKDIVAIPKELIKNGIHTPTGFKVGDHLHMVVATCTACHSAKLVTQNRATKEGWKDMIVWMQETQNLWDLGENEEPILSYLAKHYGPEETGRRKPLENIEWYSLDP